MLYSLLLLDNHKDLNNNSNTNTNTSGLCVLDTNRFIHFWLQSLETWGERQFLKAYVNHTMLTPSPRCAQHILRCLRSQFIFAGWDPKNMIWSDQTQKAQSLPSIVDLNCLFKNPQILRIIYTPSFISCLGIYYDRWWLSYSFCMGIRLHYLTMHRD